MALQCLGGELDHFSQHLRLSAPPIFFPLYIIWTRVHDTPYCDGFVRLSRGPDEPCFHTFWAVGFTSIGPVLEWKYRARCPINYVPGHLSRLLGCVAPAGCALPSNAFGLATISPSDISKRRMRYGQRASGSKKRLMNVISSYGFC